MNKVKMKFMQNAPNFVIVVGLFALLYLFLGGLVLCFTGNWRFGVFLALLTSAGIGVVLHFFHRCEKNCETPFDEIMAKHKKYWETHDR